MSQNITFQEIFRLMQLWGAANGINVEKLIIVQTNGDKMAVSMPRTLDTTQPTPKPKKRYSRDMLRAIYAVVPAYTDAPITAKAIKSKSGYRSRSAVYACLRRLLDTGRIVEVEHKFKRAPA